MRKAFLKRTADLLQKNRRRKRWRKIVISLSLVVALLTSFLLIHPAITMERKASCGQEEHTHTKECYEKKLICGKEENIKAEISETEGAEPVDEHTHSEACYEDVLICEKQEHKHEEACYPKETEEKEEKENEASEDEKAENAEARTLKAAHSDYTVEVDCPAKAGIPEDAELKVREIKKDSDEYKDYYEKARKAVEENDDKTDITFARFFDISFEADGKEIEPEAKVEVKITYDDKVEVPESGEVKSVHFGDKTEVLKTKTNESNGKMDEVKFDAESFSVYGIVGTETLTTDYITAEGDTYKISVTCEPDAKIPQGATLSVTEITPKDDVFEDYLKEFENKTGNKFVQFVRFFDITILNAEGEEIQPSSEVIVNIELEDKAEREEASGKNIDIEVIHFKDGKSNLLDIEDEEDITFKADSFSVYGIEGTSDYDGNTVIPDGPAETSNVKAAPLLRSTAARDVPDHEKYLSDNGDGTYKLALNVTGSSTTITSSNKADIILVLDESTSMNQASGSDNDAVFNNDGEYFRFHYYSESDPYYYFRVDDFKTTTNGKPNHGSGVLYGQYAVQESNLAGHDVIGNTYGKADPTDRLLYQFLYGTRYDVSTREKVMYEAVQTLAKELLDGSGTVRVSVVLFGSNVATSVNWATDADTVMAGIDQTAPVDQATNWNGALDQAYSQLDSSRSEADKYVIFLSDGNPSGGDCGDLTSGVEKAKKIVNKGKVNFYSISTASDAQNMENLANEAGGTYYNGNNKEGLETAFSAIITKIQNTLGVQGVKIDDGTTSTVVKTDGQKANLLDIDTSSFKYYRSGGTENGRTKYNPSTNTIVVDEETVNIGEEWTTEDDSAPPVATIDDNGDVHWDLSSLKVLENDVTYTVTFDVWPSQETLDYISDLKNGYIQYSELDANIQKYLSEDYKIKTNTGATLTYTDTRTSEGEQTQKFVDPDPKSVDAAKEVAVSKKWNNSLDNRSTQITEDITLFVTRDGVDRNPVTLSNSTTPAWEASSWISYGIMTVKDGVVDLKTTGHDYSFSEKLDTVTYNWQFEVETVRPMLINGGPQVTMLRLIDASKVPNSIKSASSENATATSEGYTYYKLTIDGTVKYYVVDEAAAKLSATNHRRSYLDVVKNVTGKDIPNGDKFTFTMSVNTNITGADATNTSSDAWVWFSIWNTKTNSQVTDPDAATATGLRWQLNDDNGTVVTEKPTADNFNGCFCVTNGQSITVSMQNGYSLRFLNLPVGATYSITESSTMPREGYSFVSVSGQRGYDKDQKKETTDDWITESAGTVSGQTISGTIECSESAYKATIVNNWSTVDVQLKKVDETKDNLTGSTFELRTGSAWGTLIDTFSPGGTTTVIDDETGEEVKVELNNPINLGGLGIGKYKLTETIVPDGYVITTKDIYFEVYKDNGNLAAKMIDQDGNDLSILDGVSFGCQDGSYLITVENTPGVELPHTGGSGILPYTLSGLLLMCAAALMYGFVLRRRRERRVHR